MALPDEGRPLHHRRMPPSLLAPDLIVFLGCLFFIGGAAAASEPRVAAVMLPPLFASESGEKAVAAAELACDQLARELEKAPSLRIVDRSQLDRILKERRLGADAPGAIVSYDAMIRLEIDAVRPVPLIRLRVVDLSNGNIVAESLHPWSVPLPEQAVTKMAQQCRAKLRGLARSGPKRLRVRLLEVENTGKSARLEPLASRLRETFASALSRSEGVLLVHHLEAATAKEESLLLTLGLSRLGGGRQFVPQSDATIELRIRELDGEGKAFEQTRVEVAWRVRMGEHYSGDWATASAEVKEFDKLIKDAWTRCAAELGKAAPAAAGDYLDEMALRRKQAQAELDAAPKGFDLKVDQAKKRLEHVAAAAKLDPTWEEAAFQLVFASVYDICSIPCYGAGVREAARYLQRFNSDRKRRTAVADNAFFWATSRFVYFKGYEKVELTADDRLTLDALKEIIDTFTAGEPEDLPGIAMPIAMHFVYRGMVLTGVDKQQRRRWMADTIRLGGRDASLVSHSPRVHDQVVLETKAYFRMHAARLLVEEDDPKAARPYVEELISLMATSASASRLQNGDYILKQAGICAERIKDADLTAKLQAAVNRHSLMFPLTICWPEFTAWKRLPNGGLPRVNVQTIAYDKRVAAKPLVQCADRMYCIVPGGGPKGVPGVGFVPLDSQGKPAGKIQLLSAQPAQWPREIFSSVVAKGRIWLGTTDGVLEYDPAKGAWRSFGPGQGLPDWAVETLVPLEDGSIFCNGGNRPSQGFFCQIDPSTAEIKLLRRFEEKSFPRFAHKGLQFAWQANGRIMGFIGDDGLVTIPAMGDGEPAWRKWPGPQSPCSYFGSPVYGLAVVSGRRFVLCQDALREIDDNGKVLRIWTKELCQRPIAGPNNLPQHEIVLLSDVPDPLYGRCGRAMAQDSSHLFIPDGFILCYEPATDTWYGPLETEPWTAPSRAVSGDCGIWFSSDMGLIYLSTADFIAAARSAGRAATTEQLRRKRDEQLALLGPLEQAKGAATMRQWEKAREFCAAALEKGPASTEAMLLMGLVHEPYGLNEPDKAIEYYGRLAAVKDNPPAALAGLVHQYRLQIAARRYAEALRIGKLIEQHYPRNSMGETLAQYNRWLAKQINPKKEAGK